MNTTSWAKDRVNELRDDPEYETELLLFDINELIASRLDELGMRKADLAERLGVSKAFVTKLLRGNQNVTMRTLVNVANALGTRIDIEFLPKPSAYYEQTDEADADLRESALLAIEVDEREQIALAA